MIDLYLAVTALNVGFQRFAQILQYPIVEDGKQTLLPTSKDHTVSDHLRHSCILTARFSFVLTGTTELHGRIQDLSIRVKKLEAALQAIHATASTTIHPLLTDEERIQIALDDNVNVETEEPDADDAETMFSMLSIEKDVTTSRMTASHYSLWYLDGDKVRNP